MQSRHHQRSHQPVQHRGQRCLDNNISFNFEDHSMEQPREALRSCSRSNGGWPSSPAICSEAGCSGKWFLKRIGYVRLGWVLLG
jgi:hypothetical protein